MISKVDFPYIKFLIESGIGPYVEPTFIAKPHPIETLKSFFGSKFQRSILLVVNIMALKSDAICSSCFGSVIRA